MSVKRLKSISGEIVPSAPHVPDTADRIVRKVVLVHAGEAGAPVTLYSADGEITFDDARIQAVVDSQNDLIDKLAEHYGGFGKIPTGAFTPILDQHESDSTNRVIGRLTGRLTFERRAVPKVGRDVACAVSEITWLGNETVERVQDGRIYHLSIGIDEATNTLTETSAVIDPAAPGAMILKKGLALMKPIRSVYKGKTVEVSYVDGHGWAFRIDGDSRPREVRTYDTSEAALSAACKIIDKDSKLEGVKMKQHLMTLKAAQADLKKLSTSLVKTRATAKLAAAKANVTKRLSAVVRGGKMTPAEFKKVNVNHLAALDSKAIDAVVAAYEAREPQVLVGQRGTTAALEFSKVGERLEKKQTKKLKSEIRGDFKRMGARLKDADEDVDMPTKHLEEEPRLDEETTKLEDEENVPVIEEPGADMEAMQRQMDEMNTQISRIAGVVGDLVDQAQGEDAEGESSAELSGEEDDEEVPEPKEIDNDKDPKKELADGDDKPDAEKE